MVTESGKAGKFSELYHHAKFDIYHIYGVRENLSVIFAQHCLVGRSVGPTLIITYIFHVSQKIK